MKVFDAVTGELLAVAAAGDRPARETAEARPLFLIFPPAPCPPSTATSATDRARNRTRPHHRKNGGMGRDTVPTPYTIAYERFAGK